MSTTTTNLGLTVGIDKTTTSPPAYVDILEANFQAIDQFAGGVRAKPTAETHVVSSWTALADKTPYTYSATITATATIGSNTLVELINDNAVLFATHGFAIGAVSGQTVTIYSVGEPSEDVSLTLEIGG